MNKVAKTFLRWIQQRNPSKDLEYQRMIARKYWDRFGEEIIKKTIKHSACTSTAQFVKLSNYYLNN